MSATRYAVACLAGDGIGPEVMAEASRAVTAVSRLHGFVVDESHVPFGGEALVRSGHPLPPSTRAAYLGADAVLVAAPRDPALARVESELDLRAEITWVRFQPGGDVVLLSPLDEASAPWTIERAFALARRRRARVASVHPNRAWRDLVEETAERHDGLLVEHLSVATALPALAFELARFDVVVTGELFADALVELAVAAELGPRVVATCRLAEHGPGVFMPNHGPARAIAGQGVANPSSMLLAAALMLGEGLGEHGAAQTLQGAVLSALANGTRTPDMRGGGRAGTTRDFAAAVLHGLPAAVANAEFPRESFA